MSPSDERYDAKLAVLTENVRLHVKREESIVFPYMKKACSRQELSALATLIERVKKVGPTRPHPYAPDTPPSNLIANIPAAVLDRARDAGKALLGKVSGSN